MPSASFSPPRRPLVLVFSGALMFLKEVIPKSATRVGKHVEKALKEIDGHRALKYAALQQIGRIEKLKELEKKLQRPMRNGHKEIDALRKIAMSMYEFEVGKSWLRGKIGRTSCRERV